MLAATTEKNRSRGASANGTDHPGTEADALNTSTSVDPTKHRDDSTYDPLRPQAARWRLILSIDHVTTQQLLASPSGQIASIWSVRQP